MPVESAAATRSSRSRCLVAERWPCIASAGRMGGTGQFEGCGEPDVAWLQFIMIGAGGAAGGCLILPPSWPDLSGCRDWRCSSGFSRISWPFFTASARSSRFVVILVSGLRAGLRLVDPAVADRRHDAHGGRGMTYDVNAIRGDFPILSRRGERRAAGLPRQRRVGAEAAGGDRCGDAGLFEEYANVHRGLHYLSNLATEKYEAVRGTIARFLNAASEEEIVFTSGTTEGDQPGRLRLGRAALAGGGRDRAVDHGASRQHRALAFPARTAGGGAEMGGRRRERRPRPAGGDRRDRAADETGGGHAHVERAGHQGRRDGDLRGRAGEGRAGAGRRLAGGGPHAVDVQDIGCDFYAITGHKLYGPSRLGRDLDPARAHGRDAPLHRRRRHDPRGRRATPSPGTTRR